MPRTPILLTLLLLASQAYAAPRYMSRVRLRAEAPAPAPSPSPSPAPAAEPAELRLPRKIVIAHRTEPAGEPTLHAHARFIDAEALDSFFPARPESGGGFIPLTMRRQGIFPREDAEAARAQHTAVFAGNGASASINAPVEALGQHNRDQGGRPAEPARKSNRSRFYLR